MHAIDFTTALALLLRDGARRDSFRANPSGTAAQLNVRPEDRAVLAMLSPAELDAQADVLLRKRLDRVKRLAPVLCAALAGELWPRFREYARHQWHDDAVGDACAFCEHVSQSRWVSRAELHRLRFLGGPHRLRVHWVRDRWVRNRRRSGIQILRRATDGTVREIFLHPGL